MVVKKASIVIWCGNAANQRGLVNKIAKEFPIAGIVVDRKTGIGAARRFPDIAAMIWDRLRFHTVYGAWKNLMQYYATRYPEWPEVPLLEVNGINDDKAAEFTRTKNPDLIVVSGTGLIKNKELLELPASIGIINLHTGLSPFVKGGPNCTNWCIANNTFNLVGSTIMWLNAGIDSGNIITTEAIDIRSAESLNEAHIRVMEHAHDLYLRSIRYLLNAPPPYNSVPQKSLGEGKLYFTKMWTPGKRKELLINWKKRRKTDPGDAPRLIPLPG